MNADDIRLVLLTAHALAAVVALVTGARVVVVGDGLIAHVVSTWAMTLLLVPSLALGFAGFDLGTRLVFGGLAVLAAVMSVRASAVARGSSPVRTERATPTPHAVDVIGFNVISLVVAGTIVPLLRIGAGPWLITADVVVCILLVRRFVQARRRVAERRGVGEAAA